MAGGPTGLEQNLRGHLRLDEEPCNAPRWRVRRLFARAEAEFEPALRAFGYYRAQLTKTLRFDDACWVAVFALELNERVSIRQRDIQVRGEAAQDPSLGRVLAGLPLSEGAPLNHGDYAAIKDRLRRFAAERGYLAFRFERQELRVDPDQAAADILLVANSGPRYRFGELRLSEQPLDEEFVRRMIGVQAGQPYEVQAITALNRALRDTGYYQRVEVRPLRAQAEGIDVPLELLLEPAKRHAWRAGVGFSTDIGPRASLRYDNRFVNTRGHRFESALSLSPVLSGLSADYAIPGVDPRRETFSFGAQLAHEDNDSARSDSATLTARQTMARGDWTYSRFIELLYENSQIGQEEADATLLMAGVALDRAVADDLLKTRRGYRIALEARAAHDALLSSTSLLRFHAKLKGIYRFGDAGRLTVRGDAGLSLVDDFDELPASLRFFAGGDESVRGYAYKALGPVDDDGEPRGGKHLLSTSLEYEHPVVGDEWWVAGFIDAGNAFDSDDIALRYGYGLGLRWYSPVGRVRFDLAFPDDTSDDDWRIHFGLGADL